MKHIICLLILSAAFSLQAQTGVAINNDDSDPDNSAILDVKSTDKGALFPRMTEAQRDAIGTPATGLLIYQTDNTPGFYYYNGSMWVALGGGGGGSIDTHYARTTSDLSLTLTYQDISELSFALSPGVYRVDGLFYMSETASTNDADMSLSYTGTLGTITLRIDAETYAQTGSWDTDLGSGDILITSSAANTETLEGYIEVTTAGTLTFRVKNHASSGGTFHTGSTISLIQVQ